jgi:hypothetical protein
MSEEATTTANAGEATEQQQSTPKTFSQEEVDRIVGDRLARERKNYEGFDDYKAAAEKLPTLESERDELAGKVQKFEAEKQHSALVTEVAKAAGVPADALRGADRDELTAHAEQIKSLLKPTGPVIPNQEKQPSHVAPSDERAAVKKLFGSD